MGESLTTWIAGPSDGQLPGNDCAILDANSGKVAVRHPMGLQSVYYAKHHDGYVVAPSAAPIVKRLPRVTLSRTWLALYVADFHALCFGTPFEEIHELPAGHALLLRDGRAEVRRTHTFDTRTVTVDSQEVLHQYRDAFIAAVSRTIQSEGGVAAENSGGLDSASVISTANSLGSSDRVELTFGFEQFTGDAAAMREVAAVAGLEHRTFGPPSWRQVERQFTANCEALGYPPRHGVMYVVEPGVEWVRQRGMKVVLSGWGGDHAVTSFASGVPHELARRRAVGSLWRSQGRGIRGALRTVRALAAAQRTPRLRDPEQDLCESVLSIDAIRDLQLPAIVDPFYRGWNSYDTVNEFLVERRLPLAHGRAAESYALRHVLGVEYRYPMLDPGLIQTYLSAPTQEKQGNGWGRYLHRRALQGIVPDSILWQRDKNLGENCYQPPDTSDRPPFQVDQIPPPLREVLSMKTLRQPGVNLESLRHISAWVTSLRGKAWG